MNRDIELIKVLENWKEEKITIRPSAIDSFQNCSRQWAMTFLGGIRSIPGGRAAIGTAVHAAIEQEWKEAILTGKKDFNISAMSDLAAAELAEMDQEGIKYDKDENLNTATSDAVSGVKTFTSDIVPFTEIPEAVEERYTIALDNPVVENISGTVDYISPTVIADVKTSKRKPVIANYNTQQTIYKLLAEANGRTVEHNLIQGVVLKTRPEGHIMELIPNEAKAKFAVNTILAVLTTFYSQKIAPDMLFRGNTKYYLCDKRYCAMYSTCPYVNGGK